MTVFVFKVDNIIDLVAVSKSDNVKAGVANVIFSVDNIVNLNGKIVRKI